MMRCAYVFTTVNGHDACLRVWEGGGVGGGGGVDLSFVCVWANVYVCICHSRDRKTIFLTSMDRNKGLKS